MLKEIKQKIKKIEKEVEENCQNLDLIKINTELDYLLKYIDKFIYFKNGKIYSKTLKRSELESGIIKLLLIKKVKNQIFNIESDLIDNLLSIIVESILKYNDIENLNKKLKNKDLKKSNFSNDYFELYIPIDEVLILGSNGLEIRLSISFEDPNFYYFISERQFFNSYIGLMKDGEIFELMNQTGVSPDIFFKLNGNLILFNNVENSLKDISGDGQIFSIREIIERNFKI